MAISNLLTNVDDDFLAKAKSYCKVDGNLEDDIIKIFILSARKDIIGQVGSKIDTFFDDNPIFDGAVFMKTYHSYNNRDSTLNAMTFDITDGYYSMINALKDAYREEIMEMENE